MLNHFSSNYYRLNFIGSNRLIFQFESSPRAEEANTGKKETVTKYPASDSPASNPKYFDGQEKKVIDTIIKLSGGGEVTDKMIKRVKENFAYLKEDYREAQKRLSKIPNLEQRVHEDVNFLIERVNSELKARERIKKNPKLQKIYDGLQDSTFKAEELLLKVEKVLDSEKNPDIAIQKVMSEIFRHNFIERYPSKPANPNELVNGDNQLSKEQMAKVFEYMGINFDNLTFSADQLAKIQIVNNMFYNFRGMNYIELGLLDAKGNVKKEGLDHLFKYKSAENNANRESERMEDEIQHIRRRFGEMSPMMKALQDYKKGPDGKKGKLPTITYAGRALDLNQIVAEQDSEISKFSGLFKDSKALEGVDNNEKAKEMPQTLASLFEYRFDENSGAIRNIADKMPAPIMARLEALGMSEAKITELDQGKIRGIEFKSNGKKMEITIGKHGFGDDKQPYLKAYFGNYRRIAEKPINLTDISQELPKMQQYQADNEKYAAQVMNEFFPKESVDKPLSFRDNSLSRSHILSLKEDYLGTVMKPRANDLDGVDADRIKEINKVLPIILANQKELGITDDMTIFEALLKVCSAPNAKELLQKDYKTVIAELKNPKGIYYHGIEPAHVYKGDEIDYEKAIPESRTSKNPELLMRKEQLAKMKTGDKLSVKFQGENYNFTLDGSFLNHEYRFKLDGHPNVDYFKMNVVDLVNRSPEEQLQHMMGSSFVKQAIDMEKLFKGLKSPEEISKRVSLDRNFSKGELFENKYLKILPVTKEQLQLLRDLNQNKNCQIRLDTDKYGKITNLQIKWRNEKESKNYYLDSQSGDYWRLSSLADTNSSREYKFYDAKTKDIPTKLKQSSSNPRS